MTEIYVIYFTEFVGGWEEFKDHSPILYYESEEKAGEVLELLNSGLKENLRAKTLQDWEDQKRSLARYKILAEQDLLDPYEREPGVWKDIESTIDSHWSYSSKYHVRSIKLADASSPQELAAHFDKYGPNRIQ